MKPSPGGQQLWRAAGALSLLLSVSLSFAQPKPLNDDFAGRTVLTGASISLSASNKGATKEPGEPDHAGGTGGSSVWWTWTAPANGEVRITTDGSSR